MYWNRKRNCIGVYDLQTNCQVGQVILSADYTECMGTLGEPYRLQSFQIHRGELSPYWQTQKMVALKKYAGMSPIYARIAAFPTERNGMGLLKIKNG